MRTSITFPYSTYGFVKGSIGTISAFSCNNCHLVLNGERPIITGQSEPPIQRNRSVVTVSLFICVPPMISARCVCLAITTCTYSPASFCPNADCCLPHTAISFASFSTLSSDTGFPQWLQLRLPMFGSLQ